MGWLDGWSYRKSVTLSRASGAVTNYQMRLLVGESSGAAGEDVDCDELCQPDFDDLRFTTSDGTTLCDYWIESVTGVTPNCLATVWIEFPTIGTGATTFYMYYGKADAPAVSNGVNTFVKFDNFEWGANGDSLDTNGGGITWTKSGSPIISTTRSYGGTRSAEFPYNAYGYFSQGVSTELAFRMRNYKEADTQYFCTRWGNGTKNISMWVASNERVYYYDTADRWTGYSVAANEWYTIELANINHIAGTYDIYLNGSLIKSGAVMTSSGDNNGVIRIGYPFSSGTKMWVDNVIVRNWRSTEPAWGAWGNQEQETVADTFRAYIYVPNVSWLSKSLLKRREI